MAKIVLTISPETDYYFYRQKVLDFLREDKIQNFIYLLPVNRAVRYLKKDIIKQFRGKSVRDPYIFTFDSFMQQIYMKAFPKAPKLINSTMQLILLEHVLAKNKIDFSFFTSSQAFRQGMVRKIGQMINEFRQFGFTPDKIIESAEGAKYNDFSKIAGLLAAEKGDRFIDENSLVTQVLNNLDRSIFNEIFPKAEKLFISGYGIYTPLMIRAVNLLKNWVDIEIKLEYSAGNQPLFENTSRAYTELKNLAVAEEKTAREDPLSANLFQLVDMNCPLKNMRDIITIQRTADQGMELNYIAVQIKKLHLGQSIPLHKIGVTFPNLEKSAEEIRQVFDEFEIPYNLSTGYSLKKSQLIGSFLQVLKVVKNGYLVPDVQNLISSPFLSPDHRINFKEFQEIINTFRVSRFSSGWFEKHGQKFQSMETEKAAVFEQLKQIFLTLENLKTAFTASEFHEKYILVLRELGFLDWYQNNSRFLSVREKEKEFRAFNRFIQLLDQTTWMQEKILQNKNIDLDDYYRYLNIIISEAEYSVREFSDCGVQIMPRLEIHSIDCDVLFLGGLTEGVFPRKISSDIFFTDLERRDMGLLSSGDLVNQDRFQFYQLLKLPAKKVYLTYPAFEGEVELVRSSFIDSLTEIAEVEHILEFPRELDISPGKNIRGQVGYLLESQPDNAALESYLHIYYAGPDMHEFWMNNIKLALDKLRWDRVTNFEGNLTGNTMVGSILKKNNENYSVTALESYAFCPMQYYLSRVLKLSETEVFETEISALEKGSIIHTILFEFFSQLKAEGLNRQPWKFREKLLKIAEKELAGQPFSGIHWELEKERLFGNEENPGLLERFLQIEEEEISKTGYFPEYFELSFGKPKNNSNQDINSISKHIELKHGEETIKLSGKIDRIDITPDNKYIVIDYKIGKSAAKLNAEKIFQGTSLQLPVYIKAAQEVLKNREVQPVGAMYYILPDAQNCQRKLVILDANAAAEFTNSLRGIFLIPNSAYSVNSSVLNFSQFIDHAVEYIFKYINNINSGNMEHTLNVDDPQCQTYCEYSKICRKDVSKLLARKKEIKIKKA